MMHVSILHDRIDAACTYTYAAKIAIRTALAGGYRSVSLFDTVQDWRI